MNEQETAKEYIIKKFTSIRQFCADAQINYSTLYNDKDFVRYMRLAKRTEPTKKWIKKSSFNLIKKRLSEKDTSLHEISKSNNVLYSGLYYALQRSTKENIRHSYFISIIRKHTEIKDSEIYEQYPEIKGTNPSSETEPRDTTETDAANRTEDGKCLES